MHNYFKPKYSKKSRRMPLVLWSGGVDSTYLVYHHLQHSRNIDTLSVDGGQCHQKVMRESIARMALWRAFQHADLDQDLGRTARELAVPETKGDTHTAHGLLNRNAGFQQVLSWIMGVMRYYNPDRHSHVEMAYIMNDDMAPYMHYIAQTFEALGMMQFSEPVLVYFPLARTRKETIYPLLERVTIRSAREGVDRMSLLDLTWVCETPYIEGHCGTCAACLREVQVRQYNGMEPRKMVAMDYRNVRLREISPDPARNNPHQPLPNFNYLMAFGEVFPTRDYPFLHSEREVQLDSEIIRPGDPDYVGSTAEHVADRDEELISELPYNSGGTISIDRDEQEGVVVTDDDPVASQS